MEEMLKELMESEKWIELKAAIVDGNSSCASCKGGNCKGSTCKSG